MKPSSSYQAYRNFEHTLTKHTQVIIPVKNYLDDKDTAEPDPPKIICSRTVAEMVADKPYRIVYYHDAPIYLLIMCQKKEGNKIDNIGFAFYDEKHGFFEGEIADFLMSQPKLRITELQIRATAGLEDIMGKAT
jgi:hypothetical protein